MIPQTVAIRDMVKPELSQEAAQLKKVLARDRVDEVVEARKAESGEEKKSAMSLEKAVEESNKMAQIMNSQIRFNIDHDTGQVIVKVINKETHEVIRQIPSEEMVKLASRAEELRGLIFNEEG